jgi:hypothetical protein
MMDMDLPTCGERERQGPENWQRAEHCLSYRLKYLLSSLRRKDRFFSFRRTKLLADVLKDVLKQEHEQEWHLADSVGPDSGARRQRFAGPVRDHS